MNGIEDGDYHNGTVVSGMQVMSDRIPIPSLHPFLSWLPRCTGTVKITAVSGLSHLKLQVITSHHISHHPPRTGKLHLHYWRDGTSGKRTVRILHYLSPPTGGWPWVIYERVCVVGMVPYKLTAVPYRAEVYSSIPISFLRRERGNLIE